MNYYKDKITNQVYAYDDDQLATVARMNELEALIQNKEPGYLEAKHIQEQAYLEVDSLKFQLDNAIESEEAKEVISSLTMALNEAAEAYNQAMAVYAPINTEYQLLKEEYAAILPVFFEVRDNISAMKKMTPKEIDAYLNPPISKEQLIAEAEQKKQLLLNEASEAIAPLNDAVDLDMATDEEIALLKEWKKYRVLLNRVDTSAEPDIEWPQKPL
ncbi:tail fiber assembly protein [Providencia huaxiensis]|uniref:tail fiber assembly protein n=1 Tax=Providencia huaxiensis TaxID=2027290 RepID=UPI002FE06463